jgi:hypothetical protein
MKVNGDKKSKQISLDISPVFFHIVFKLFQAPVITYDEIFKPWRQMETVLLPKPFLDPTPATIQPPLGYLGLLCVWQT